MLVEIGLPLSLAIIMFSLGLGLELDDFAKIGKFPKAFFIGFSNQLLVVPLVGFIIASSFNLSPSLSVGIMILALCPGGVTTNVLAKLANGNVALSISLTSVISLISTVTAPIIIALSLGYFQGANAPIVNLTKLGFSIFILTIVPVVLAMLVTRFLPKVTQKISKFFEVITVLLFVIIIGFILIDNWQLFIKIFPVLGPALIALNVALIIIGLLTSKIGNLSYQDRTTVAIESGVQNGTMGITIAALLLSTSADGFNNYAMPSAIYGITMYLITVPFIIWRRVAEPS